MKRRASYRKAHVFPGFMDNSISSSSIILTMNL